MSLRLNLFGPPRLAQHNGSVALAFERRSQLLAHLALRRGAAARTELAAMLWPQAPIEQAHANLRKTLFRIRSLPWAPAIAVDEHALAFDGTSDVAEFEAAIAQRRWSEALDIAAAPLLAGFDDDSCEPWSVWLRTERERLRTAWRLAAQQCLKDAADPAASLALSSRLLADDPLDESALRAHMLAYVQQGQPTRARDAYRAYADELAREMGTEPEAALKALHDALGTPGVDAGTLPAPESEPRLVGRTAERREARAHLDAGCRLLCLIGPGGVGKSCLAHHLLSELAPQYPEGTAYVPMDDVESPAALGARLARELAVQTGSADPLQAVTAFLSQRRMLLILDNFEHLQAAAKQLQALLDACPRVQILVTSRARLGLACEQLLPLDGLPCPEPEDTDRLDAFDAVRLFVRAAQAVEPTLQPVAEASAIAEICRLVDGLPLALEIAAAWTRLLPCPAIAAELRQGIALLTESDGARPPRHASMATVFEQSWRRLGAAERMTWARLTVFVGGFTTDAARAVAGATLPVLAGLIDQSLLRKLGARADLHPLLRQLAAVHLTGSERDATRDAHAVYYLQGLVPLMERLKRGDRQVLQQVEDDFENIRAAWRRAGSRGLVPALQSAAMPMMKFCDLRGRFIEAIALLDEAANGACAGDARLPPLLNAVMAHFEFRTGRFADAQARAERALLASRATGDHDTRLISFKVLGHCAAEQGHLLLARRRHRQALAQAPAAIDPHSAAGMLQNLGLVETRLGRLDTARLLFTRALVEHRGMGDAASEAACLGNLGLLEADSGQLDAAAAHFEACAALSDRLQLRSIKMAALKNLTDLSVLRCDPAAARHYGRQALELADQMGHHMVRSWVHLQLAEAAVQQSDGVAARNALRTALEIAITLNHVPTQLDCVICFCKLMHAEGEQAAAARLLTYAADHPATLAVVRGRAQERLAQWRVSQRDAAPAAAAAVDLWTLVHRLVAETPAGHAALIESLRAA